MILFDSVNAMDEASFTLRDVIYICVMFLGAAGAWFAIKIKLREIDLLIEKANDKLNQHEEKFMASKATNKAKIVELKETLEKRMDTFQGDNIREIMKIEDIVSKMSDKFDHYVGDQQRFREEVITKLAQIK